MLESGRGICTTKGQVFFYNHTFYHEPLNIEDVPQSFIRLKSIHVTILSLLFLEGPT